MDGDIGNLVEQLATLDVVETLRRVHRMPLPDAELVVEFDKLACQMMGRSMFGSQNVRNRRIVAFFGAPSLVIAKLWELLVKHSGPLPQHAKTIHLLWALHLVKVYSSEHVLSSSVGATEKNYRKWTWFFIQELAYLEPEVVSIYLIIQQYCLILLMCVPFTVDSLGEQAHR